MSEEKSAVSEEREVEQAQASSDEQKESAKEMNFSKLRKKGDLLERHNRLLEEKLTRIESALERMSSPARQEGKQPSGSSIFDAYGLERGGLVESDKLAMVLESERERNRKEAEEISRSTMSKLQKEQYAERLYDRYPDYASVVNEENMSLLEREDEEFLESLKENPDEYKRRELAYKKIKKILDKKKVESQSVNPQDIVNKNMQSNYGFTSSGFGGSTREFNWKEFNSNPEMQRQAYLKLKANQKRGR